VNKYDDDDDDMRSESYLLGLCELFPRMDGKNGRWKNVAGGNSSSDIIINRKSLEGKLSLKISISVNW